MSGIGTSNSYEILAQLAAGGMAELYLARSTGVGGVQRHVVLKRILPAHALDPEFVTMFLDEARIAAQLRHPNVAQFYDVGRLGKSYFYTMEYVHGETVAALVHKASSVDQPVPLAHVLAIAAGTAAGLHHAHTRVGADRKPLAIIHRDVTPANIMVDFEGAVKLLDFGVAKAKGRTTETVAGVIKGKVAYLSPEQCTGAAARSGVLDGRSDLFSLGVCIYELLVQHYLFQRHSDLATVGAIVNEPIAPPSAIRRDIPREIDQLVMTALAKDRAQRFASADAMRDAIEQVATKLGLSLSPTGLGRYLRSLFGHRPEPWLDVEALIPVTVVTSEVIKDVEPTMSIPLQPKPASESMDRLEDLINNVKKVRSPVAFEATMDDETFDESESTTIHHSGRHKLPSASKHPGWESTLAHPLLDPSSLDETSRVLPEDFPSHITTLGDPDLETVPKPKLSSPSLPPAPTAPIHVPAVLQPVPRTPPHGMAIPHTPYPAPQRAATPWPARQARWNIPRLVLAGLLLVAIILAIWFAVA